MGRLKAGQTPTPHRERMKNYRLSLVQAGGRRVLADLGPEGAQALEAVMARDSLSIKDALTAALVEHARRASA